MRINKKHKNYYLCSSCGYQVFRGVIKKNIAENKQPTIHFYVEGVRLIRKELLDSNQVWNLVRYNIVK